MAWDLVPCNKKLSVMKVKIIIPALAVFSAFILQSCYAPQSIVKLQPKEEPVKWVQGQAFVSDSLYGVSYEVSFDRVENNQYIFDFHITNRSNMPILINPAEFYYCPLDGAMNSIAPGKILAIDPEKEIEQIDKALARNDAQRKSQFGVALLAIGADIASGIIVASDRNPRNDFIRMPIADGVHAAIIASAIENEAEAENLSDLKQTWSKAVIRKTTLNSNYTMYGKVFFPATPNAGYIRIYVPVDNDLIAFSFQQTRTSVSPQ